MGAPFLPVRGILGSAYLAVNPRFRVMADPFSGEELVAVQALTPDATLVHGARGDSRGNLLIPRVSDWGLAVTASRMVIATVEELVAGPPPGYAGVAPHPRHPPHGPGPVPRRRRPHRLSGLLPPGRRAPGLIPGKLPGGGVLRPVPGRPRPGAPGVASRAPASRHFPSGAAVQATGLARGPESAEYPELFPTFFPNKARRRRPKPGPRWAG